MGRARNRTVTAPSLRVGAACSLRRRTHTATDLAEVAHTKATGIARASCLMIAAGVHYGTDKHQPACHALHAAHIRSPSHDAGPYRDSPTEWLGGTL